MLAARIRAGVRIGQMIELLRDSTTNVQLKRGDSGLVVGFTTDGNIVVKWAGGHVVDLDPATESYQALLPHMADTA